MISQLPWKRSWLLLVIISLLFTGTMAQSKSLAIIQRWKGKVAFPPQRQLKKVPVLIIDSDTLEKLWSDFGIPSKVPEVDFSREIVLVATGGIGVTLHPTLDETGDIQVHWSTTRELIVVPYYYIVTVRREGVKSVEGQPLGENKPLSIHPHYRSVHNPLESCNVTVST